MALNRARRNDLRNTVIRCRRLLEEATSGILEGRFGIQRSGEIEDRANMGHLSADELEYREQVVSHLLHMRASGVAPKDAVARLVREVSYTHLNRLCAYKLLETQGSLRRVVGRGLGSDEVVGRGIKSNGFMFYLGDHPYDQTLWSTGKQDVAYRHFLQWLGDALADEVGVLFSSSDVANQLFPPHRVLESVLELLNAEHLEEIWKEDETIGWVYQYYTPKELRDQARKESQAPRNSYELSFRNQFYTPDYVVRFLVDNTLGRTWYEMRQGNTRLEDECEYLVRRKHAVFLASGEKEPKPFRPSAERYVSPGGGEPEDMWVRPNPELQNLEGVLRYAVRVNGYEYAEHYLGEDCGRLANERREEYDKTGRWRGTFEELRCCLFLEQRRRRYAEERQQGEIPPDVQALHRAICDRWNLEVEHIHFRAPKDPRELKILDPACGSGHFLLYCFELLQVIYDEAYDESGLGESLREEYPDRSEFRRAVPALILRHNLYGIDIDFRATQIAALALWLRAQRAGSDSGEKGGERPRITRSNIVCAEPMPGERDMLEEFTRTLAPNLLSQLVKVVFNNMALAGEAGSLLKIEEEIRSAIYRAKIQWQREFDRATDRSGNELLLTHSEMDRLYSRTGSQTGLFDVSQISDAEFWDRAAGQVTEALEAYARSVSGGAGYQRSLFAEDAARGFAFVNVCQERFDVVLMNPPFGEASKPSKPYIEKNYPRTKNDVYAAFVERGLGWLHPGGMLGAITSRTGFFLTSFRKWREEIVLGEARPTVVADLGQGVLDTAMVETAAYVLEKAK